MEEMEPEFVFRIKTELHILNKRGISARIIKEGSYYVYYPQIKTSGLTKNLPEVADVIVPVPPGYPSSPIDMPGLLKDSPLIPFVAGGSNPQATVTLNGNQWTVLSYHPYTNGGGPSWDPRQHGFHDYYNQLFVWLNRLL